MVIGWLLLMIIARVVIVDGNSVVTVDVYCNVMHVS